ncbi:MAG TPA: quinone-dependent dihydroorotate dehydrogenase [Candidatus Saccharimonadia bacterium]
MIPVFSRWSHTLYTGVAKPLLFRRPPDAVHADMVRLASRAQRLTPLRQAVARSWAYHNPALLSQQLAGLTFTNPVGLSAGFDKNFELVPLMRALGFGFMEGGSLTYEVCAGNPRPWFYRLPQSRSLVVNAGLANQGVERIGRRLQGYPRDLFTGFPLNISVAKTNSPAAASDEAAIADYCGSLSHLASANLGQLYTLNISCPNTFGGQPFTTSARLERLLAAVDDLRLTRPVFIKMPSHLDWPAFNELTAVAARHASVTGLTISNLAYREQVKLDDALPETIPGKLSGRPTWERSNQLIRATRLAYGDRFLIIGVGGIFSAADAYTKIRLGANLVELITGLIYEGPALIGQINHGLAELLARDGYTNIGQAVGADL